MVLDNGHDEKLFRISSIAIAPTWRCDAECKHCFIPKSYRRNGPCDNKLIQKAIEELPDEIRTVHFTGGEPFVCKDRLLTLVEKISRSGRQAAVVTNGLWTRNWREAVEVLKRASRVGLKHISVSIDSYHSPVLSVEEVVRFLGKARDYGIDVGLKGTGRKSTFLKRRIKRSGVLDGLIVNTQWESLESAGKAAGLPKDCRSVRPEGIRCHMISQPIIVPSGDIFACCSARMLEFRNDVLVLGNLKTKSTSRLLECHQKSFIAAGVIAFGPGGMLKALKIERPAVSPTLCSYCVRIMNDKSILKEIRRKMEQDSRVRKEIVGRIMLLEEMNRQQND